MTTKDFLLEIGCEELPAKGLYAFVEKIGSELVHALNNVNLPSETYQVFVTPRRLSVFIRSLATKQADSQVEKRGPAVNAPDAARKGFAKSLNIEEDKLLQENGYWIYRYQESGQTTATLLPQLLQTVIKKISGVKWMRWGNHTTAFLRPVHWVVMLLGEELIDAEVFGIKTSRETQGHRFHHPAKLFITHPGDYENILLEEGFVQADFLKRRESIKTEIQKLASSHQANVYLDEDLLDEVTGLVELPVPLWCQFPEAFLKLPREVLISSMQHHQKCFPVMNQDDQLLPYFITVSNIKSHDPKKVVLGNERVMRARLSDAAFFYDKDLAENFYARFDRLSPILFQQKLGSMADKVERIRVLAEKLAKALHVDQQKVSKAVHLCKCDLTTDMVNEFPELQGVMGEYYAVAQGEKEDIALAIREHYLPRFAGDVLPKSAVGVVVALADRLDTINSIFSIQQIPTGDKDPFGLRRAANGIIRMMIEKELDGLNLSDFVDEAVRQFMLDRLPSYYQDQQIKTDVIQSVLEVEKDCLFDIHRRIMAVNAFRLLPESSALSEANKRVKNILRKNDQLETSLQSVDVSLFETQAEKSLYDGLIENDISGKPIQYETVLKQLAKLKTSVDNFFDQVMVEAEDEKVKANRLQLLKHLRHLFLQVADISLLQP